MPTRKKTTRRTKTRQGKTARRKVVPVSRQPAPRRAKKTQSTADLRVDAINRSADGQIICDLLMELNINHQDCVVDKDFMTLQLSPADGVAFFALLLNQVKRSFKESIGYQYKTSNTEHVLVSVPVNILAEMKKILTMILTQN